MQPKPVETQTQEAWALRYVVLLWISLICMIPFDLVQFDEPDKLGEDVNDEGIG